MEPARWRAVCQSCGRAFPVTDGDAEEFERAGWPECCGADMLILYLPHGLLVPDPAEPPPA